MRLTLPVLKPSARFTGSSDWSVFSSDASLCPFSFEVFLLPLPGATVLNSFSGFAPLTDVTATWLGTLSKSTFFLRTCCLLGGSFSWTRLSEMAWLSMWILGTIFLIRAGFGVLCVIFPMTELSEAWEDLSLLSDEYEVLCGRVLEDPNPAKSSSWRSRNTFLVFLSGF